MSNEHEHDHEGGIISVREFLEFTGGFKEFAARVEMALKSLQDGQAQTNQHLTRLNGQTIAHAKAIATLPCLQQSTPTPCKTPAVQWKHPAVITGASVSGLAVLYSMFEFGKAVAALFR